MTSTAIQKLWQKDLPPVVITLCKKKAVEALGAWTSTVTGILTAARAVCEVQAKIGGKGGRGTNPGAFGKWAEDELKVSEQTAGQLATIGERYNELYSSRYSLPPSWGAIYEIAKIKDDDWRRRVLHRVKPDTERHAIPYLVADETEQPAPKKATRKKKETRALPAQSESQPEPGPREAALTTTLAGSVLRTVKDLEDRVNTALASGSLAPETKRFMLNNYLGPSRELIEAMEKKLAEPAGMDS